MPWHAAATFRSRSNGSGIGIWQEWAGVHCESLPPFKAAAHDGKATWCWITYLQPVAAGSHEFQESPTHTSAGCKRRHEPKDQPTSLSTGRHRFLASPTRAGAGSDGRHEQREHRDQPTSFATGGHESHGGRLWRGTMPAVQPTRLGSANAADSVLCPISHLRLKFRQNDRRQKVFKHHQMTNTKCLQKQGHDRRQACPKCGKKNLRDRDSATSAPEMLPSPEALMSQPPPPWNGAEGNGRHFPTPYNGAGLLWTGKKSGEEVEKRAVRSRLRLVDMTGTNTDNS